MSGQEYRSGPPPPRQEGADRETSTPSSGDPVGDADSLPEWAKKYAACELNAGAKAVVVQHGLEERGLSPQQAQAVVERYLSVRLGLAEQHQVLDDRRELRRLIIRSLLILMGALLCVAAVAATMTSVAWEGLIGVGLGVVGVGFIFYGWRGVHRIPDREAVLGNTGDPRPWPETSAPFAANEHVEPARPTQSTDRGIERDNRIRRTAP